MPKKKTTNPYLRYGFITPFFLICLVISLFIPVVYATESSALNLTDWNTNMSEALGFDDQGFVGGMVLSAILVMCMVLPIALINKRKKGIYPELAVTILALVISVGVGWLHYWILLVTGLLIALLFAYSMRGMFGG